MVNEETPLLAKFTNFLTKKGQKAKAGRIMKKVFKILQNLQFPTCLVWQDAVRTSCRDLAQQHRLPMQNTKSKVNGII